MKSLMTTPINLFKKFSTYVNTVFSFVMFFLASYLMIMHGLTKGPYEVALVWSFFILCVPVGTTGSYFVYPIKRFTGQSFRYAELTLWFGAIAFTGYIFFFDRVHYYATTSTHLLYRILSRPWPSWTILAICALGTFYRTFWGYTHREQSMLRYHLINIFLVVVGFAALGYLSYQELIIIVNIST